MGRVSVISCATDVTARDKPDYCCRSVDSPVFCGYFTGGSPLEKSVSSSVDGASVASCSREVGTFACVLVGLPSQLARISALSLGQVLNRCLFPLVLLSCVMGAFVIARVFVVLHLVHRQNLSVSVLRHSMERVSSLCRFRTVLLSCVMGAFVIARVFAVLHLVHRQNLSVSVLR